MGGPYEMGGDGDDDSAPAAYKRGLFAGRAEAEALLKDREQTIGTLELRFEDHHNHWVAENKDLEARLAAAQIELDAREKDALGLMQMNNELTEKFAREKKIATELVNEKLELSTRLAAAEKGSDHWEKLAMDRKARIAALESAWKNLEKSIKEEIEFIEGEHPLSSMPKQVFDEKVRTLKIVLAEMTKFKPSGDGKGGRIPQVVGGAEPGHDTGCDDPAPETPEGTKPKECPHCKATTLERCNVDGCTNWHCIACGHTVVEEVEKRYKLLTPHVCAEDNTKGG